MANKIVKDSQLPIFVKEVQVAPAGFDPNASPLPKVNDLIAVGAVVGLIGQTPRKGEDTAFYATVDTAALIRVSGVSGTFTDKQPVYLKSDGSLNSAASGGASAVGYADRPKTASAAGDLWVQLVPRTGA